MAILAYTAMSAARMWWMRMPWRREPVARVAGLLKASRHACHSLRLALVNRVWTIRISFLVERCLHLSRVT